LCRQALSRQFSSRHPPNKKATGIVNKFWSPRQETYKLALHQTQDTSTAILVESMLISL
jgi:hypothetical protein